MFNYIVLADVLMMLLIGFNITHLITLFAEQLSLGLNKVYTAQEICFQMKHETHFSPQIRCKKNKWADTPALNTLKEEIRHLVTLLSK